MLVSYSPDSYEIALRLSKPGLGLDHGVLVPERGSEALRANRILIFNLFLQQMFGSPESFCQTT